METQKILSKLKSMMPLLSTTEQRLGHYVLENPSKILSMSTKELAAESQVSEASIIRFTRKLGVSGYKSFKLQISAELAASHAHAPSPVELEEKDNSLEIYQKLAAYAITSIESTGKTLNQHDLDEAVNLISQTAKHGDQIHLSGMGTASVLIKELQIKLMRLGIPSVYYEDIHLRFEAVALLKKGDLLICFTALGRSVQNQQLIQLASKRGANIILITQYGNAKLAEKATITLYTSTIENNFRLDSQTSITVQSIIVDTLFLSLALKELPKIKQDFEEANTLFEAINFYTP